MEGGARHQAPSNFVNLFSNVNDKCRFVKCWNASKCWNSPISHGDSLTKMWMVGVQTGVLYGWTGVTGPAIQKKSQSVYAEPDCMTPRQDGRSKRSGLWTLYIHAKILENDKAFDKTITSWNLITYGPYQPGHNSRTIKIICTAPTTSGPVIILKYMNISYFGTEINPIVSSLTWKVSISHSGP